MPRTGRFTIRIVSLLICTVFLSSQMLQAAEIEVSTPASSILNRVAGNPAPVRSAFPPPQRYKRPSNTRLYLGMGALAVVGVALIGIGSEESGTRVEYCTGGVTTRCALQKDYDHDHKIGYQIGGAALIGGALFGMYAIHKWRR